MVLMATTQCCASMRNQYIVVKCLQQLHLYIQLHCVITVEGGACAEANGDAEEGRGLFGLPFMRRAAEQQRAAAAADAASLLHSIEAEASRQPCTPHNRHQRATDLHDILEDAQRLGASMQKAESQLRRISPSSPSTCHDAHPCRWLAFPRMSCSGMTSREQPRAASPSARA